MASLEASLRVVQRVDKRLLREVSETDSCSVDASQRGITKPAWKPSGRGVTLT